MRPDVIEARPQMDRHLDELFARYPEHLSVSDLEEIFGIRRSTAYAWLREGRIPAYRMAGTWVIFRDEVRDAVAAASNRPKDEDS